MKNEVENSQVEDDRRLKNEKPYSVTGWKKHTWEMCNAKALSHALIPF